MTCLCCLLCSVCVRAAHAVCRQSSFLVRTFKGAGRVACELRAAARKILKRDVVWMESRGPVSKPASSQCDVPLGSLASPSHSSHFKVLGVCQYGSHMFQSCSTISPFSSVSTLKIPPRDYIFGGCITSGWLGSLFLLSILTPPPPTDWQGPSSTRASSCLMLLKQGSTLFSPHEALARRCRDEAAKKRHHRLA